MPPHPGLNRVENEIKVPWIGLVSDQLGDSQHQITSWEVCSPGRQLFEGCVGHFHTLWLAPQVCWWSPKGFEIVIVRNIVKQNNQTESPPQHCVYAKDMTCKWSTYNFWDGIWCLRWFGQSKKVPTRSKKSKKKEQSLSFDLLIVVIWSLWAFN